MSLKLFVTHYFTNTRTLLNNNWHLLLLISLNRVLSLSLNIYARSLAVIMINNSPSTSPIIIYFNTTNGELTVIIMTLLLCVCIFLFFDFYFFSPIYLLNLSIFNLYYKLYLGPFCGQSY